MLPQAVRPIVTVALLTVAPAVAVAQEPVPAFTPKSPDLAVGLSLLGTVVPTALALQNRNGGGAGWLMFYGMFFGPSTGYFYAGRTGRAFGGAGTRLGFGALAALGITASCGGDVLWGCKDEKTANAVAVVGLALIGLSAVYDIATVGRAATEWNLQHQPPRLSVLPAVNPVAHSAGLEVRLTF